jgi:hypothetical protein
MSLPVQSDPPGETTSSGLSLAGKCITNLEVTRNRLAYFRLALITALKCFLV